MRQATPISNDSGASRPAMSRLVGGTAAPAALATLAGALAAMLAAVTLAAVTLAVAPAAVEAQDPPPPLPEVTIDFPDFEEFRLDNGLEVLYLEHRSQPVTAVRLYARTGSAADPADRRGLASLAASVLTKGTETRTADEIAGAIEDVGASLNASAGRDWTTVFSTTLAEHLPLALELVSDVARDASFPEEELERERTRTLSALRAELGQPQQIAARKFNAVVYGEDHPYGADRTPESVRALERDDLVEFHRGAFHPRNALLVVAGDVDRDEVERLAAEHFGDWEPAEPLRVEMPAPPERDAKRIYLVHRPGAAQVNVRVGHLGIAPENPDFFALQVLNRVLGGGPDARLFQILREEKGWTYGAYSNFSRRAHMGAFQARAEVRPEVADSTVAEVLNQLERLRDEPIPEDEFEAAVNYLVGSFPLRIETPSQIAGQIAQAKLLGLPYEYVTQFRERILDVTPDDVRRAARDYIYPDRAAVVVVGDGAELLPMLEPLGEVALFDVEGERLTRADLEPGEAPALDGTRLREMTRAYSLMMQDNEMGTGNYELRRDGEEWVAVTDLSAGMIQQEQTHRFRVSDLRPVSVEYRGVQGGATVEADLRVEDDRVAGEARLPPQAGGDQEIDLELPPGGLLSGMEEFAVAVADLGPDVRFSLPVFNFMEGEFDTVTFRVRGEETVEVPAGEFEVWRVETEGGPMALDLFVRKAPPHVLVKQDFAAAPISLELVELEEAAE